MANVAMYPGVDHAGCLSYLERVDVGGGSMFVIACAGLESDQINLVALHPCQAAALVGMLRKALEEMPPAEVTSAPGADSKPAPGKQD